MYPTWLWLRRSAALSVALFGLAASIALLFSRGGWSYEWGWALEQAAGPTYLLCPLLAGAVAFERSRHVAPTIDLFARSALRPARWAMPLAFTIAMIAAPVLTVAVAAVVVSRNSPGPPTNLWILLEVPAALLGAAALGVLAGRGLRPNVAGPVAAAGCFALGLLSKTFGVPSLFRAGGATGSLIGLEPIPMIVIGSILCHLSVVMITVVRERWVPTGTDQRWSSWPNVLAGSLVVLIGAFGLVLGGGNTYRTSSEPEVCVGNHPTVCGPASGRAVIAIGQASLSDALNDLESSGVLWRDRYVLARDSDFGTLQQDAGRLRISPDGIQNGRADQWEIAATLATPRMCQAYFGSTAGTLLDRQSEVIDWIVAELARPAAGTAPTSVKAAYEELSTCDPATGG